MQSDDKKEKEKKEKKAAPAPAADAAKDGDDAQVDARYSVRVCPHVSAKLKGISLRGITSIRNTPLIQRICLVCDIDSCK